MTNIIDSLLKSEVSLIVFLQKQYNYEDTSFLSIISVLLDPSIILSIIVPLTAAFDTALFFDLLITGLFADFSNVALKWILMGDRPFWWVHETKLYGILERPYIYQTELTCQSSGGNPSGHVAIATAILFVLADYANRRVTMSQKGENTKLAMQIVLWHAYVVVLLLLSFSRIILGCHFPHQCLLGAVTAFITTKYISMNGLNSKVENASKRHIARWIAGMIGVCISIAIVYKILDVDPQWSIRIAFKWCESPFFLKPSSTAWYSLMKMIGTALGIFFAAPLNKRLYFCNKSQLNLTNATPAIQNPEIPSTAEPTNTSNVLADTNTLDYRFSVPLTALLIALHQIALHYSPKHYGIVIYYSYTFVLYALFVYFVVTCIPKWCRHKIAQD